MPHSLEHTCAACGARIVIRGARAFTPLPCPECGASFRARTEIGGYHLDEVVARSGLGVIFRARDQGGAEIAVKVMQPPYAAAPVDVEYFSAEVWAIARLDHPHCVRIFATGVDHGLAWIAMEWLPQGSLAERIVSRGKLREAEVLAIGLQAAGALSAAQAAGHAHRDVSPENLVFAEARTVKVTDFGQAALYQIAADDLGTMWGRPCFVSPERMRGEPEEAHSDIFALGGVLFYALTGELPRGGEPNPLATLEMIESGDLRVEEWAPGIHEKTAQILNRMLAGEPAARFQHWGDVVTQLSHAGTLVARRDSPAAETEVRPRAPASSFGPPRRVRHRSTLALGWVMAGAVFVVLASLLAVFIVWRRQPVRLRPAPPVRVAAVTPAAATPVATPRPTTPRPTTPLPAKPPATTRAAEATPRRAPKKPSASPTPVANPRRARQVE